MAAPTREDQRSREFARKPDDRVRMRMEAHPQMVPNAFFNSDTDQVVLVGLFGRGPLLAQLDENQADPDPERHEFLVEFPRNYAPFTGSSAPPHRQQTPATAKVVKKASERTSEVRAPGPAPAGGENGASKSMYPSGGAGDGIAQAGVGYGRDFAAIASSGAGVTAHGDQITIGGEKMRAEQNVSKGATQESPLFGLVPKTIGTWFASDIHPAVGEVLSVVAYSRALYAGAQALAEAADAFGTLSDLPSAQEVSDQINPSDDLRDTGRSIEDWIRGSGR